jgi:hypothetical protein
MATDDERRKTRLQRRVLDDVLRERDYQRGRWGTDHDTLHSKFEWVSIMVTWLGKAASSAIGGDSNGFRKRMVQVSAISLAAIESVDRNPES